MTSNQGCHLCTCCLLYIIYIIYSLIHAIFVLSHYIYFIYHYQGFQRCTVAGDLCGLYGNIYIYVWPRNILIKLSAMILPKSIRSFSLEIAWCVCSTFSCTFVCVLGFVLVFHHLGSSTNYLEEYQSIICCMSKKSWPIL